jgi:hypothetical protein
MAFVLLLKYNPKWAVGVSSTVFVVGIAQAGYTQVEVRKVDEETKRFQAELRVTLEKIGKDWDLTEYNKAIDKALEEYRNRLPLDYSQDVKDQWTLKALLGVKADIRIIDRFQIKTQLRLLAEQRSEIAKRLKEGTLDKKSAEGILRYLEQEERLLKVSESIADIEAKNTPDKKNEEKSDFFDFFTDYQTSINQLNNQNPQTNATSNPSLNVNSYTGSIDNIF